MHTTVQKNTQTHNTCTVGTVFSSLIQTYIYIYIYIHTHTDRHTQMYIDITPIPSSS